MPKLNFAKNRTLSGGLPQLNNPVQSWAIPITLVKVIQDIVEGDLVVTEKKINFQGTVQPLSDERLQFKAEGLRSWRWLLIHCVAGTLNLLTGDKVIFESVRYRVMSVKDYSLYAYIEYELCEDYQENSNV